MKDEALHASGCRSDIEIGSLLGNIEIDGFKGLTRLPAAALSLDAKPDPDSKAHVAEMIEAVRAGKHLTLQATAITWRQRPTPNRRFLRLAVDKLADRASSWRGKPFLTDHNTYAIAASKGTILSSKLIEESAKVAAFQQVLHVVKPDAVIGFLDGTMRSFSIGWFALGPVMCTVHGVDLRSSESCGCWPGETVTIDGKQQVVQYEFSDYEGKEVSTVVVPAVRDTSVEGIRAALAAELDIRPRRPPKEKTSMPFTRLATALKLAALSESDEDAAVTAVTALQQRATTAEIDLATQRTEVARLTAENTRLSGEAAAAQSAATDALIADAYKAGKLAYGKDAEGKNVPDALESLLRDFGKLAGRDALAAKITAMKAVVPVGVPALSTQVKEPERQLRAVPTDAEIEKTALSCGIPVDQLRASYGLPPATRAAGGGQ